MQGGGEGATLLDLAVVGAVMSMESLDCSVYFSYIQGVPKNLYRVSVASITF